MNTDQAIGVAGLVALLYFGNEFLWDMRYVRAQPHVKRAKKMPDDQWMGDLMWTLMGAGAVYYASQQGDAFNAVDWSDFGI